MHFAVTYAMTSILQGVILMTINHRIVGTGFPIVMLHGWTLDHRVMLGCMEPVFSVRDEWKRIYIDLPGMGDSESPIDILNSDDMLNSVLQLLDELIPNEPFLVCGQSYGGYLGLGIAHVRKNLVRGMCLIAPKVLTDNVYLRVPQKQVLKQDPTLMATLMPEDAEKFDAYAVVQGPDEWERYRDLILAGSKVADEAFLSRIRQNGYGFTFSLDSKSSYEFPMLVITGRQDHVVGYENQLELIERYPRGTFVVLDMAGHNLQIERPLVFEALVHDWLGRTHLDLNGK